MLTRFQRKGRTAAAPGLAWPPGAPGGSSARPVDERGQVPGRRLSQFAARDLADGRLGQAVAEDYRWSSCASNALGEADPLLAPHDVFEQLAPDPATRRAAYRRFLHETVPDDKLAAIRLHANPQHALGTEAFQARMDAELKRPVTLGRPGRPRKVREIGL